jgi:hypothetical protein
VLRQESRRDNLWESTERPMAQSHLNLGNRKGERSGWNSGHFTLDERVHGTHWLTWPQTRSGRGSEKYWTPVRQNSVPRNNRFAPVPPPHKKPALQNAENGREKSTSFRRIETFLTNWGGYVLEKAPRFVRSKLYGMLKCWLSTLLTAKSQPPPTTK